MLKGEHPLVTYDLEMTGKALSARKIRCGHPSSFTANDRPVSEN